MMLSSSLCSSFMSMFLPVRFLTPGRVKGRLGCRKPRDGHPVRGATHIIHPNVITEFHRSRVPPLLSANPYLEVSVGPSTFVHTHFDQLPDTVLINGLKRIGRQYLLLQIVTHKPANIITAETKPHLGEVIGPK